MRMYNIVLLILLLLVYGCNAGSKHYTVKVEGVVLDADTKEPLSGIQVFAYDYYEYYGWGNFFKSYFYFDTSSLSGMDIENKTLTDHRGRFSIIFSGIGQPVIKYFESPYKAKYIEYIDGTHKNEIIYLEKYQGN